MKGVGYNNVKAGVLKPLKHGTRVVMKNVHIIDRYEKLIRCQLRYRTVNLGNGHFGVRA